MAVPELSLAAFTKGTQRDRDQFSASLYGGLRQFGFVILTDHGIDPVFLDKAYGCAAEFFTQPLENKMQHDSGVGGQRGYTAFGREHAKGRQLPDLKEFWHVGRELPAGHPLAALYPPNHWPEHPESFRTTFLSLYDALEAAGLAMLDALVPPLAVDPQYFRRMTADGNSILRLLHYPPIAADAPQGAVRAAAHEDINLITLLVSANGAGLQLLDRNGDWLAIETARENIIVDAGDMLARITNDVIPATTHRVINPDGPNISRYSMPFFMHPHPDAMLECIPSCISNGAKYPPIAAGAFLNQRLKEIGLTN